MPIDLFLINLDNEEDFLSKENNIKGGFKDKEEKTQDYNLKISLYKKMPKLIYEVLGVSLLITVIIYNISNNYPIEETIIFISLLTITIVRILPSLNLLSQSYSSLKSSEYSFNLIIKIIKNNFKKKNINIKTFQGSLINEPWTIKNKSNTFFKVS